ncbi:MAG: amidohydrolase family protein [Fusobacteriaceae bacterium]
MNRTKVYINGKILKRENNQIKLVNHSFKVINGKFSDFAIPPKTGEEVVDLKGKIVFPSFINCHVHLGESLFRGLTGEWSLENYLKFTEWWNYKLKDKKDDAWNNSAAGALTEIMESGTSVICTARGEQVIENFDIIGYLGYPVMKSKKLSFFLDNFYEKFENFKNTEKTSEKITVGIFLHSLYTNDAASLEKAAYGVKNGAKFLSVHIAETLSVTESVSSVWKSDEISVLESTQLLNENTILVHCGFLNESQLRKVGEKGSKIVLCPISNKKFGTRTPDISLLEKMKISWCWGTDGAGTGNNLDPVYHMKKIYLMNKKKITLENLFSGFLWGAAEILNLKNIGEIKEGYQGDFIVFESQTMKKILFSKKIKRSLYLKGNLTTAPEFSKNSEYYIPENLSMKKALKIMKGDMRG